MWACVAAPQVTASIDEIILGRVKEGVWDDVVRRAALTPAMYKPRAPEISNEKSEMGLGDEYAKQYEEESACHAARPRETRRVTRLLEPSSVSRGGFPVPAACLVVCARARELTTLAPCPSHPPPHRILLTPPPTRPCTRPPPCRAVLGHTPEQNAKQKKQHEACRELYAQLGARLDALFNFHAVPKPFEREASIRGNISAIQLEEATPVAMAAHEALAPEEVHAPKTGNALTTRNELSQAERKAARRKKKRVHKRKTDESAERTQLAATLNPLGKAAQKLQADKDAKQLAEAKRKGTVIDGMGGDGGAKAKGGKGKGGGSPEIGGRERAGTQFTRSAQFFKNMQENGRNGGKRAPVDDSPMVTATKAARAKL